MRQFYYSFIPIFCFYKRIFRLLIPSPLRIIFQNCSEWETNTCQIRYEFIELINRSKKEAYLFQNGWSQPIAYSLGFSNYWGYACSC